MAGARRVLRRSRVRSGAHSRARRARGPPFGPGAARDGHPPGQHHGGHGPGAGDGRSSGGATRPGRRPAHHGPGALLLIGRARAQELAPNQYSTYMPSAANSPAAVPRIHPSGSRGAARWP
ncbi:MAG: hypothetical protein ACK559_39265, partial [bacterium]